MLAPIPKYTMGDILTKSEIKRLIKDYGKLEAPKEQKKRRALKKLKSKKKKQ